MHQDRGAEKGRLKHDCMLLCNKPLEPSPWIGAHEALDEGRLQHEQHSRMQRIQNFQLEGQEKLIGAGHPRHALPENGGLADQWCLDDGDILCRPILVLPHLQALDTANAEIVAE